ncbi:MAG: SUMF1/EgtB/PvdO family nonheme iron enzyme [bacterium]
MMKTIKVFLASAGILNQERTQIELCISRKNNKLVEKQVQFELVIWEQLLHSFRRKRVQDYFNKEMLKCEIVIALFFKRVGQFTLEEFEIAHANLYAGHKPHYLFVYFSSGPIDEEVLEIKELKQRIQKHEQIYCSYTSTEDLILQVNQQLDLVASEIAEGYEGGHGSVSKEKQEQHFGNNEVSSTDRPSELEQSLSNYKAWAYKMHEKLPIRGINTDLENVDVRIEQVYVKMRAWVQPKLDDDTLHTRHILKRLKEEKQYPSLGIKAAIKKAHKSKTNTIVITGRPGSGKTVLQKYILLTLISGKGPHKLGLERNMIPFYVTIREIARENFRLYLVQRDENAFLRFLAEVVHLKAFGISESLLKNLFHRRRAIVLLDGLDEISDEILRKNVFEWIDAVRLSPLCIPFIITTRPCVYCGEAVLDQDHPVMRLDIEDFLEQDVKSFLKNWFGVLESSRFYGMRSFFRKWRGYRRGVNLARRILQSSIRKMAVNPLMLQILAIVCSDPERDILDEIGSAPNKGTFMSRCVDVLLEKWNIAKGLDNLLTGNEQRSILEPVGFWLHKEGRDSAPKVEVEEQMKEPLSSIQNGRFLPSQLLDNLRDRSGLFVGHTPTEYGFSLHQFQEYMAAERILKRGTADILVKNYNQPYWHEVLLFSLGQSGDAFWDQFMRQLIRSEYFGQLILDHEIVRIVKKRPVKPLVDALNESCLPQVNRENTIRILGKMGGDAIAVLRRLAKVGDQSLATIAYESLKSLDAAIGIPAPHFKRIIHQKDGSEMVLIPAGTFLYGEEWPWPYFDEKNVSHQQIVSVEDFYIDIYPVTNEKYCMFLNHVKPDPIKFKRWIGFWSKVKSKHGNFHYRERYRKHPIVGVSLAGAMSYCKWAGKELPSEVEWEKAARGTIGNIYPWGNRWDRHKARNCDSSLPFIFGTCKVDKYPQGKSPFGCFGMAGNTWEWTRDRWSIGSSKDKGVENVEGKGQVVRGGWFGGNESLCRACYRTKFNREKCHLEVGFRCVLHSRLDKAGKSG